MKTSNGVTFFESGVDYITATGLGGKATDAMSELGIQLLRESKELGNEIKPWGMAGFHGFKCGPMCMGQRQRELIIRASSGWAWRYWKEIYEHADNVSRLDVQATIADGREPAERLKMHYREGRRFANRGAHPRTISMLTTNNGASTIYINKRISDRFGRVYDKAAESGLYYYCGCLRYEVELKGDPAKSMAHSLSIASDPDSLAAREALTFFSERGLSVRQYIPGSAGGSTSPQVHLMRDGRQRPPDVTDHQRQLDWLSKSVRATVQKLIRSGRVQDVHEALGLLAHAQPNSELGPSGPTVK